MAEEKQFGSVKRFGVRYGRTVRSKIAIIESILKGKHKCPYCNKESVKRISAGIWGCNKCGAKFTGRAYDFDRKITLSSVQREEILPESVKAEVGEEKQEKHEHHSAKKEEKEEKKEKAEKAEKEEKKEKKAKKAKKKSSKKASKGDKEESEE
jgi:large subunit ribosomal protein L37Ae